MRCIQTKNVIVKLLNKKKQKKKHRIEGNTKLSGGIGIGVKKMSLLSGLGNRMKICSI